MKYTCIKFRLNQLTLASLCGILLYGVSHVVLAADINKTSAGVVIEGFDTTAYFTQGRAVKGVPEFSYQWKGGTWYFANERARDLFVKDPVRYAPQFGGYCSNGLSDDHKIGADPRNWRIIDGKLYLFFSDYGREQWAGNVKSLIQAADDTWQDLKTE